MFLTFEGGEGVGKSTVIQAVAERLKEFPATGGHGILCSREPGGTETGRRLRAIFLDPPKGESLSVEAEFLLVSAARAQHVKHVISPALARGQWVLCDRFADSSRVYQGIVGGLNPELIEQVIGATTFGVEPDLTFLLDCPIEISMTRVSSRRPGTYSGTAGCDSGNRYDRAVKDVHHAIRNGYLKIQQAFPHRIFLLDAANRPQATVEAIMNRISSFLAARGAM
jgi:dTMP kinase